MSQMNIHLCSNPPPAFCILGIFPRATLGVGSAHVRELVETIHICFAERRKASNCERIIPFFRIKGTDFHSLEHIVPFLEVVRVRNEVVELTDEPKRVLSSPTGDVEQIEILVRIRLFFNGTKWEELD